MIVTLGALASTFFADVAAPAALLAHAAIVLATRSAAPAAPMRLIVMGNLLVGR